MRRSAARVLVVVLVFPAVVRAVEPGGAEVLTAEGYRNAFVRNLDRMRSKFYVREDAFLARDSTHIHVAALAAACEMRAWEWTREARYAQSAVGRLRAIAAKVGDLSEADFFTPLPLTFAFQKASAAGVVDDDLRRALETFATRRFRARDTLALNNQTLLRACGLELASQVWTGRPEAKSWHQYATTIAALLERIEDVPENAPGYNALDVIAVWLLSDLLKAPGLTRNAGIEAMFRRYRDQVSPAGFLAPYGDAGAAPSHFEADWPMDSAWAHYAAAFERAAREYHDPTLRWAAARMTEAGTRHMPLGESYTDIEPLFYGSFAADWVDEAATPVRPAIGSALLRRRDETRTDALDKLILARSRAPAAPFLLADLYCRGHHAHVNQHGAVSYYEYDNTPLLTSLGYNNREPAHANLVLVAPAAAPFPNHPEGFTPGVWQEASLPTVRLEAADPSRPFVKRIDLLNFRITARRRGVDFSAADVRLRGTGRPDMVLDGLRSAQGWSGHPKQTQEGLAWNVAPGVHFLEKKGFARTFDCREYPSLTFRWKLSNNDEQARPIILRVQGATHSIDYHAQARQLAPTLLKAEVRATEAELRGTLLYADWFTPGTTLVREMVVMNSGELVVCDTLRPGDSTMNLVAGPLWHLASQVPPTAGPYWFNSEGGRMELLVWLAPAPGREFGSQARDVWSKEHQQSVFARQPIVPGRPVTFVSVLVPHERDTRAAAIADGIAVEARDSGRVRVTPGRERRAVEFSTRTGP